MADNEIFKAASADFVSSIENLPARERVIFSSCSTPNQLIADVRKLDVIVKEKRRAKLYLAPIERVTERLRFYFAAIDVLVQCDPIHAATAWGSLRLVIQVREPMLDLPLLSLIPVIKIMYSLPAIIARSFLSSARF